MGSQTRRAQLFAWGAMREAPRQMQAVEVSKPINLDHDSMEILLLSFVISSAVQEILKQVILVLREKADKSYR